MTPRELVRINRRKELFPVGTRVELDFMDDIQSPPTGTRGNVLFVDDIGTIHVNWDNGSSLGVTFEDKVHFVDEIHFYGMRIRPFGIGCQPKDGLIGRYEDDFPEGMRKPDVIYIKKYWDCIAYSRMLTDDEVCHYSLDYLGSVDKDSI